MQLSCVALAFAFAAASAATARIEIGVAPNGERFILGESDSDKAHRLAPTLLSLSDSELTGHIERYSRANRLEPGLVQAVMQVESGYNRRALSNKGAMGLMQLMPDTARSLRVQDPWDAEQNVRGGTAYLRALLDRFQGRLQDALAGYNAGPGAVTRFKGIPPYRETQEYVRKVLGLYHGRNVAVGNKVLLSRDAQNRFVLSVLPPAIQR